jgi:hypothetical protein
MASPFDDSTHTGKDKKEDHPNPENFKDVNRALGLRPNTCDSYGYEHQ